MSLPVDTIAVHVKGSVFKSFSECCSTSTFYSRLFYHLLLSLIFFLSFVMIHDKILEVTLSASIFPELCSHLHCFTTATLPWSFAMGQHHTLHMDHLH